LARPDISQGRKHFRELWSKNKWEAENLAQREGTLSELASRLSSTRVFGRGNNLGTRG